ncbi:MAG: VanZ family protein [Flavobacteriales bacterium]|nr:VanZ family protein [Flavobacteriales bacterium]
MLWRPLRPAMAWGGLILVLCLTPGAALPTWQWADLLSVDKLVHAVIFGVLVMLLGRGFREQGLGSVLVPLALPLAAVLGIAYGGAMELMQQIPGLGRRGDWMDVIANTIGSILAFFGLRWWWGRQRRTTEAKDV